MTVLVAEVTLFGPATWWAGKGVNGFDSGCRARGSVPRKATMISLTTRRKKSRADTSQREFALAA